MKALLFLMLTCCPPSNAMSCALQMRIGQWFTKKELSEERLRALTARRVSVTDSKRATFDGILLSAHRSEHEIVLRLLEADGTVRTLEYAIATKRAFPVIEVRGDLPSLVAQEDAKYADRSLPILPKRSLLDALRDKERNARPVRLVYVEADNQSFRELEGRLELPDEGEQVSAAITGKPLQIRVIGTAGTHAVEKRRIVRVYL